MINTDETILNSLVDNVQFTLSWDKKSNAVILPILENTVSNYGLAAQGEPLEKDGKMYLIFASVLPVELPSYFSTNDEILLMSMTKEYPVSIGNKIHIAEDSFANSINGSYFISLYGINNTGTIHTSVVDITDLYEANLSIYPNPTTNGLVYVEMNLGKSQNITISILDIHGRVIENNNYQRAAGLLKTELNLSSYERGVYFVRVNSDKLNTIQKVVVQ